VETDGDSANDDGFGVNLRPGELLEMVKLVPVDLLVQFHQLLPVLERNGTVVEDRDRGAGAYRLRYHVREADGRRRRQRSIAIRDKAVAHVIGVLVVILQSERRREERRAKQAERDRLKRLKAMRAEAIRLGGGGRRRRRRIAKEYDEAIAQGPMAVWLYELNAPYLKPERPPGRPRKGGLKLSLDGSNPSGHTPGPRTHVFPKNGPGNPGGSSCL